MRLLTKHNPSATPPSTELLETIFSDYEQLRIARTSELVRGARRQGDTVRVVSGEEACRARNQAVQAVYADKNFVGKWLDFFTHPFRMGESEI